MNRKDLLLKALSDDKEQIEHALQGELVIDENESGFIYARADKEACANFINTAYGNVIYWIKVLMDNNGNIPDGLME